MISVHDLKDYGDYDEEIMVWDTIQKLSHKMMSYLVFQNQMKKFGAHIMKIVNLNMSLIQKNYAEESSDDAARQAYMERAKELGYPVTDFKQKHPNDIICHNNIK